MNWKEVFKRNSVIFEANARIGSWKVRRRYLSLAKMFPEVLPSQGSRAGKDASGMVRKRLEARGRFLVPKKRGTLRILYVGTDYSQDSSGILQALARFGEVIPFEARPGRYGVLWPKDRLLSVREENSRRLIEETEKAIASGPVDIVLGQMWGFTVAEAALQEVRTMGPVVANISMDDRHAFRGKKYRGRWTGTSGLIPALDLAATAAPECRAWYMAEGCPAIYFPEASDPDLFHPFPGEKEHDVCFVGAKYGVRRKVVDSIRQAGIRVAAYGKGWPNGPISTDGVPELFSRSRIVLGFGTIGHTKDMFALKMRDFDGPMSGSLYLTHHNPDLESLYDIGREIETYSTPDECVQKVRYYLDHPGRAEEIGRSGRLRALRDHTWERRFEELFRIAGILECGEASQ